MFDPCFVRTPLSRGCRLPARERARKTTDEHTGRNIALFDHMYVCLEGRTGCTVVNGDNDYTAPESQLVTVDTCALCSDGNDADNSDNGFVDKSFGDVSVDDVNVVYRDDFDTDKECSDS
jgi:hypothetical protein